MKGYHNLSYSYFEGPLNKIFQTNAPYVNIISFFRHYKKITRALPFLVIYSLYRPVMKVCEGVPSSNLRYT